MITKMFDVLVDKINDRRSLVGRIVSVCSAVSLSILCIDRVRAGGTTVNVFCCSLCQNNNCVGGISSWGCSGTWCWTCCYSPSPGIQGGVTYQCYECYGPGANSGQFSIGCDTPGSDGCGNVKCSKAIAAGSC